MRPHTIRKLFLSLPLLLLPSLAWAQTDTAICDETDASTPASTDELLTAQCGASTNEKLSVDELSAYIRIDTTNPIECDSGTTLPATCNIGACFWDTDADTDGSLYFCRAADTWKEVDDDGAAAGDVTDVFDCATGNCAEITATDGDRLDFDQVNPDTADEGIILPQAVACASTIQEGQICWETDRDVPWIGDAVAAQEIVTVDATQTLTGKTIDATNTVTINAADITDQGAGTDITADLEEDAHCAEHDSADVDCSGETIVFATPHTTEVNDLTAAVTWATVPDANVTGSGERDEVCGTTDLDASCEINANVIDFADVKQDNTLAGNPALAVDECFFVATATGGGFICEGSTADTNEFLALMPDQNPADSTVRLVVDTSTVTSVDGDGLTIAAGVLAADLGTSIDASEIDTDAVQLDELDDDANTPTAGDILIVEAGDATVDYITPNAGTDVTADLEEEAHCSEHNSADVDCSGETIVYAANSVNEDELAATVTLADGDLVDFGTNISSSTEGLMLPAHLTDCASATGEGQVCWEEDAANLWIGDGTTAQQMNAAGASSFGIIGAATADSSGDTITITDTVAIDLVDGNDPEDLSADFVYSNEMVAVDIGMAVDECTFRADTTGGGFVCEGSTADANEMEFLFPDENEADTSREIVIDTATQTLTNKTLTAAANAVEADDLICTNCIDDTEVTTNAGTALSADLEEEAHCSEHNSADVDCSGETIVYAANSINEDELAATITLATGDVLVLPVAAADQTTDGQIDYDSTEEVIEVGDDGVATHKFVPAGSVSGDGTLTDAGVLEVTEADALETNPSDCGANTWATTIAANGDLTCSAISGGAGITDATVAEADLVSADFGDFTCGAGAADCVLDAGVVDAAAAAASMDTKAICFYIEDPVTDEQFETVWRAPTAITAAEIYCEATAGTSVGFDFNVDDGTPAGINGSDIVCTTSGVTDSTFAGDTELADGETLDIDIGTVTGAVTAISLCLEYNIN